MTVIDIIRTAWRRKWLVLLAGLLGALLGLGLALLATPQYKATAQQYFKTNYGRNATELSQGNNYLNSHMTSFAAMATSHEVLSGAIAQTNSSLSVKTLQQYVTVSTPKDTQLLTINVLLPDPQAAADMANAIADNEILAVQKSVPVMANGKVSVNVNTITPAVAPTSHYTPRTSVNVAAGLLAGLLGGVVIAVISALFNNRARTTETVEQTAGLPVLSALTTRRQRIGGTALTALDDPKVADELRQFGAVFRHAAPAARPLVAVVTSPVEGSASSQIACNLASTLAERGERVLVIDANLHEPSLAVAVSARSSIGLTDAVQRRIPTVGAISKAPASSVDVMMAGTSVSDPASMLASAEFAALLDEVSASYDVVLVVAPATSFTSEVQGLAQHSDGYLLVVPGKGISRKLLRTSVGQLNLAGARPFGVVLDGVSKPQPLSQFAAEVPEVATRVGRGRRGKRGDA